MSSESRLPNFIVCGAQKAGTTSLFRYLNTHPDVFLPTRKELNFFNLHYDRGVDWYVDQFREVHLQSAVGEASPLYMLDPAVPARIRESLGEDVRLIFLLRDPADRAYSNYWYNVGRGVQDPAETFSRAIRTDAGRSRYIEKGYYGAQLTRFLEPFGRDRLFIMLSEELAAAPVPQLRLLFRFLSVAGNEVPTAFPRHNASRVPRRGLAQAAFRLRPAARGLKNWMENRTGFQLAPKWKRAAVGFVYREAKRPPLPEADREWLNEIFGRDKEVLENRLGIDLSPWVRT